MKKLLCITLCTLFAGGFLFAADSNTNSTWESSIGAGLTVTSGNSETLMANLNFLSAKKWYKNELLMGADATYGESQSDTEDDPATPEDETEPEKTTENYRAFAQYNRLFSEKLFGFGRAEGFRDEIADIDYRFTLSAGLGYYFIKNKRTTLSAEVGPGYIFEKQGGEANDYMTIRFAERFEHKFNDKARLWQSLEFLPQVDDWENFIINAEIGVETSLSKSLALRTYLQDTYDNEPAPGREENDLKLFAGVAYKF